MVFANKQLLIMRSSQIVFQLQIYFILYLERR